MPILPFTVNAMEIAVKNYQERYESRVTSDKFRSDGSTQSSCVIRMCVTAVAPVPPRFWAMPTRAPAT